MRNSYSLQKRVLIVYPGINLHNERQSGGMDHLLANVSGYTSNNYRVFIICAYNKKIIEKDLFGNIYFNILYSRSADAGLFNIPNQIKQNQKSTFFINYARKFIDSIYQLFIFIFIFLLNINIVHERSTKRFTRLRYIKNFRKCIKYVYEINDETYDYMSLMRADLTLVIDSNYYPNSNNYFVSPWPVSFNQINTEKLNMNREDKTIVYLGSAMAWHNFDYMFKIVNSLGDDWKIDVYGPTSTAELISKYDDKLSFKGFVDPKNIHLVLSKYKFGFSLYNDSFGLNRNKVGSPMKVIHYLLNGVIPIVNIVNDQNLKFFNLFDITDKNMDEIVQWINEMNIKYDHNMNIDMQPLIDRYSSKNYYANVLKILYREDL